jgi:hypothetical protein
MNFSLQIFLSLLAFYNRQGFYTTCVEAPDIGLDGSELETAYLDDYGDLVCSQIDLDGCIANYGGISQYV